MLALQCPFYTMAWLFGPFVAQDLVNSHRVFLFIKIYRLIEQTSYTLRVDI